MESEPSIEEVGTAQYKNKWLNWLKSLVSTARDELTCTQDRYKRNFGALLRLPAAQYQPGTFVFVRKEYSNPRLETWPKLAPVATGPYRIFETDEHTVVIRDGQINERVSKDRIVPAAQGLSSPATSSMGAPNALHDDDRNSGAA